MAAKLLSGITLSTPRLSEMLENEYLAQVAQEDSTIYERDWEHQEPTTCPMCNGVGKNIKEGDDDCLNCDSTGVEFKMVYGVKGGQSYAYTVEYGMEAKKEYCKSMREAFADQQLAGKVNEVSLLKPFALPKTIEMELMARGYNVREMMQNEVKEVANIVAREYPDFLCVPYKKF